MAQVRGTILTERDRALLAYVGVARYVSAEHVHRLVVESPNRKLVYRRLAKLCAAGSRPGDGAYLRRLEFRRAEGTAVPVWALAPAGRAIAEESVAYLRPPAQKDVGHQFLEHTLLLNDVLVELAVALRRSPVAPVSELPFRWLCEDDGVLEFEMFHRHTGATAPAVLKPDAILEVPGHQRRLFLEAETGAHSIATANPGSHGAVLNKLQRYAHFFTAMAGAGAATYYARAFPDGLFPVLVFLVHSSERKRRVEKATKDWLGAQGTSSFRVRVLSFDEAAGVLAGFIRDGRAVAAAEQRRSPSARLDVAKARQLREGYNALAEALNATRRAIAEHNARGGCQVSLPPAPVEALRALKDLIRHDLLGEPHSARKGASIR
ncbi:MULTISPECIES: replication-relaxation family protein [unclassified Anaeromyxobacter]|uniref:replication-relaxation family protein n=1 Tax=unclassified Anaeromyxobacter TaxID=2620896 RepID=UPI001F55CE9A|nr:MULTISPECIES: replication-relaxation family protein [unclassified Anaeromyxobacter]